MREEVRKHSVTGQVIQHRQVVLHHQAVTLKTVLVGDYRADGRRGLQPLLHVEIRRGLVEHVHVCLLHDHRRDGESVVDTARFR